MQILLTFVVLSICTLTCSGQSFTFIFLNTKKDKLELPADEVKKIMDGHMANIGRLAKEGKLIVAGPFEGGGGIFILNTTSVDSAAKWLSTDPGIKANRWDIELLPYQPRIGGACAVGENYEMVTYHFIRFTAQAAKLFSPNSASLIKQHDAYITEKFAKTGNVITEGIFGNAGGILVLKGDLQKEIVDADPGVQEALLQVDIKKLWVAKGSFCEK